MTDWFARHVPVPCFIAADEQNRQSLWCSSPGVFVARYETLMRMVRLLAIRDVAVNLYTPWQHTTSPVLGCRTKNAQCFFGCLKLYQKARFTASFLIADQERFGEPVFVRVFSSIKGHEVILHIWFDHTPICTLAYRQITECKDRLGTTNKTNRNVHHIKTRTISVRVKYWPSRCADLCFWRQ